MSGGPAARPGSTVIREWREADALDLTRLADDREIWLGLRDAGGISDTRHTDVERVNAEVGYWVGRGFWGRGIATAALRLLTTRAFARHPELNRLWAVPFATNLASARVLEKAGYTREGTLRQSVIKEGRILDQWMYAILRSEVAPPR